ncbi:MAG: NAD(P)H-dependent FMN reductase [Methanosaeta sp. PtaB.Bin039]|nr:MAG: NAD(P)H-dependent FMN reductase [Methanosaeta sp. PtaB.Bin039]OPY45447.1 MAG: NAD(P)H-dependent FMN reductase [Methanosaeta sp. PtaU1.Bin028]HOT06029.1 NAD(P)H-dependent oxidoreductase [Methanotrichaceae archaeon]HQF16321.1 NAD(P)H-dependent oxidoreductase [Methanotrichaceae archaeon]HQI90093.1 NAD(P)H-dependent oxidoreductase [Methanotrichaceae archaeon]
MYIPVILGTARLGRQSEKAAAFMLAQALSFGLESEILDVRDFRLEATDNTETTEKARRWEEAVLRADGFIIVSPEYNRGYPGELKMMLDLLFRQYARKPVAICGVSSGVYGGARMMQQLKTVLIALHMLPLEDAVYFSKVQDLFTEDGTIKKESYVIHARKMLEELAWHAMALSKAREQSDQDGARDQKRI